MPEYPRKPFKKVGTSIRPEVPGDALDGTIIGSTTPAAGNFTTLTSSAHVCEKIALPAPTVSGWTTDPAPLSEITDDDYAALATAGAITVASQWGYFTFDLGKAYMLTLAVYTRVTNRQQMSIHFSLDNTTFYEMCIDDVAETEAGNALIVGVTGIGRYVRVGYRNLSTGTLSLTNCSVSATGAPIA